jgi:cytochrome c oxidase subunit 2
MTRSGVARLGWPLVAGIVLSIPAFVSAAPPENLNMFDPAGPNAAGVRDLFYLVLAITGVIFLLVEGMLIYCIIRFRHKPGADAPRLASIEPPQIYGSKPIEVAWTVLPTLIVFVLFLVVARTIAQVRHSQVPEGAMRVVVIGHQWWWEYRYPQDDNPEHDIIAANEMHMPIGKPVHLELRSADVIHSFWVPRLAGKTDVVPGRTNHMWFQADETGWMLGQCAEYCKGQHANMMIRVYADTESDFQKWLDEQKKPAVDLPSARNGRKFFLSQSCVNCHRVTFPGSVAVGTFGPDLTHLMSRKTLVTGIVPNDELNLWNWVHNPQTIKPGCLMPDMHLTKPEVDLMVEYLLSLK